MEKIFAFHSEFLLIQTPKQNVFFFFQDLVHFTVFAVIWWGNEVEKRNIENHDPEINLI